MKKLLIQSFISLLFIAATYAQTVDEVLADYFAANGQDKLLETTSMETKGKIIQGQFEIPFTSYHKRPFYFKSEAEFQGMKISSAFDGEKGWSINPMMGSSDPQPLTEEQIDRMKIQADYDGILYNYKEKGYKVELTGNDKVDDIDCYVISLTRPNGDVITSYIDSENYVLLKTKSKIKVQGVDTEAETYFSNYKMVDGILQPYSIETKVNGNTAMQMAFDEFKFNVDFPDSIFDMPEVTAPADTTGSK